MKGTVSPKLSIFAVSFSAYFIETITSYGSKMSDLPKSGITPVILNVRVSYFNVLPMASPLPKALAANDSLTMASFSDVSTLSRRHPRTSYPKNSKKFGSTQYASVLKNVSPTINPGILLAVAILVHSFISGMEGKNSCAVPHVIPR